MKPTSVKSCAMSLWLPLIFLIFASNQGRPFLLMFCPNFIFWFRKILYTKKTQSHFGCHCESLWVLCCNYSNWIWVLSIPFVFCSALAVPSGLWYLIFVPGQPGNLSFFIKSICWAPWISQFQSTELLQFFIKHSLVFLELFLKYKLTGSYKLSKKQV